MKYRKKPIVVIEAEQWRKNGDHSMDYAGEQTGFENGDLRTWSGEECKAKGWEGQLVRYYRVPGMDAHDSCEHCDWMMHAHGWIDTPKGGHVVCPGDWIIKGANGEFYPCKDDVFQKSYEAVT